MHRPRCAQHRREHVSAPPVVEMVHNGHSTNGTREADGIEVEETPAEVLKVVPRPGAFLHYDVDLMILSHALLICAG